MSQPPLPLVLASTSAWRRELLAGVGLRCEGVAPGVDEDAWIGSHPQGTAVLRARAKAEAVAAWRPDSLVLGADQVIELDGATLGKPPSPTAHLAMLRSLRGRTHALHTAVCLRGPGVARELVETTLLTFRADVSDAELQAYVSSKEGAGCAGGYQLERRGPWLVERVEGCWYNVVGLPVPRLIGVLRELGWRLPA